MLLYANPVTDKFTGTCTTTEPLTIVLADHQNDFYGTVDATVVIDSTTLQVASVSATFGKDSEEITRDLTYSGTAPVTGTSAVLTGSGPDYKISGTAQAVEDRRGKKSSRLIPYIIEVVCQS
jgi:hypothetical protein